MNQTTWIIGGGALIVIAAILLFIFTGNGSSQSSAPTLEKSSPSDATAAPSVAVTPAKENTAPAAPVSGRIIESTPMEQHPTSAPKDSVVMLKTSMGEITLRLYQKNAPKTVENFIKLAKSGFYDGVRFHRVIKGFMIQSGDPLSKDDTAQSRWGTGGPGYQFADEIDPNGVLYKAGYKRGILAMANSGPNTNGSQFFIIHQDYPLPPAYTIFGEVTGGLDVVDKIAMSPTTGSPYDRPLSPITIISAEVK